MANTRAYGAPILSMYNDICPGREASCPYPHERLVREWEGARASVFYRANLPGVEAIGYIILDNLRLEPFLVSY